MAADVRVDVRRSGLRFDADATLDLSADPATVWATITDYDALPRFMPAIQACRVLERRPRPGGREKLLVQQQGEFRFMAFALTMNVRLEVEHEIERVAVARAVAFDFGTFGRRGIDVFEGRYDITPRARGSAGVQLRYGAVIGLALPLPPGVGSFAVRQNLAAQLDAVALEVARRCRTGRDAE